MKYTETIIKSLKNHGKINISKITKMLNSSNSLRNRITVDNIDPIQAFKECFDWKMENDNFVLTESNFGVVSRTKVKYAIVRLFPNTMEYRFVTYVSFYPKEFLTEEDKPAILYDEKSSAEDICSQFNIAGYSCFVVTVPDLFRYDDMKNFKVN